MKTQTQIESPEYNYEIPLRLDPYDTDSAPIAIGMIAALIVSMVIAMIYWGVILWRLPSKAGYKGAAQWIWFLLMYFPLTGGLAILTFVFAPWPVKRQLEKTESQLDELRRLVQSRTVNLNGVDNELEQMRRQMRG